MDFAVPLYLIIIFALFLVIPIMIGVYVYRDAGSRGMNASLWTLIAVLSPAAIGLIIYLLVRSDFKASDRNDKVLGVILVAVVLIPILMVGMLAAGLVNFRNASSSSIGTVDGMRVEDFADNKTVSDWINYCDEWSEGTVWWRYPQN